MSSHEISYLASKNGATDWGHRRPLPNDGLIGPLLGVNRVYVVMTDGVDEDSDGTQGFGDSRSEARGSDL